jgi:hypothetical protein
MTEFINFLKSRKFAAALCMFIGFMLLAFNLNSADAWKHFGSLLFVCSIISASIVVLVEMAKELLGAMSKEFREIHKRVQDKVENTIVNKISISFDNEVLKQHQVKGAFKKNSKPKYILSLLIEKDKVLVESLKKDSEDAVDYVNRILDQLKYSIAANQKNRQFEKERAVYKCPENQEDNQPKEEKTPSAYPRVGSRTFRIAGYFSKKLEGIKLGLGFAKKEDKNFLNSANFGFERSAIVCPLYLTKESQQKGNPRIFLTYQKIKNTTNEMNDEIEGFIQSHSTLKGAVKVREKNEPGVKMHKNPEKLGEKWGQAGIRYKFIGKKFGSKRVVAKPVELVSHDGTSKFLYEFCKVKNK